MSGEVISQQPLEEPHQLAAFITNLWDRYQRNKDEVMDRWQEVQEYRNATDTTEISSAANLFDHNIHVPLIEKIAPQLEAIILQTLIPHENWFDFQAYDAASNNKEKRHNLKEYFKNRYHVSDQNLTLSKWVSDIVDTGNGFLQMGFTNGGQMRGSKTGYIGPTTVRISPYDIVFDPVCTSFHDSFKIIREMITVGELYKRGEQGVFDKDMIKDLLSNRQNFNPQDYSTRKKNAQYVPTGYRSIEEYYNSGYVEILWFYGSIFDSYNQELMEDRTVVVADSKYVVLDQATDTWDGKPYICHTGWQPRQDNLWYRGPLENLLGMNYMANHRENAKSHALDKMIHPDMFFSGDIQPLYDEETGQINYIAPEGGQVTEIGDNTQFLQFQTEVDRMVAMSLETIGLPPQFLGFRTAGEKTLGEVTALQEGAMRPFLHKLRNMERALEFMINSHLQLTYDNMGDVVEVGIRTADGILKTSKLTKQDFRINGGFVARGASRFSQKQKLMTDLIQINATGLMALTQPHWSSVKTAEKVADFMELGGEGIIKPWVAMEEQMQAQMKQTQMQRIATDDQLQEGVLDRQIEMEEDADMGEMDEQ